MLLPSMRPPFTVHVPLTASAAIDQIARGLSAPDARCAGITSRGHVLLTLRDSERRCFSPTLDLEVADTTPGSCALSGRFGPHPHMWTLYVALYAVLSFIVLGSSVFGLVQWSLGGSISVLVLTPLALLAGGGVYLSAFFGQRLAIHQMTDLEAFLHDQLDRAQQPMPKAARHEHATDFGAYHS